MGVLYRDLKPENILIDKDGHIKLADFGLAREGVGPKDIAKSFCGSPIYLSPEMISSKGATQSTDVYGIGIFCGLQQIGLVLYEMLTGGTPFYCEDVPKLYSRIKKNKITFPGATVKFF
jgi:serine/threonine protein kinase